MKPLDDSLGERILVLRVQGGDESAFAELVARYAPRLRYFLAKVCDSRDNAEDLLQDVWYEVFRGIVRLKEPAAFRAWVYRIARDRALQTLRRKHRDLTLENCEFVAEDSSPDFSAEEAERIHQALDLLSPEHREVLVLRFLEDMGYDEIARVTNCKLGTIRSRIHYAKRALREIMQKGEENG